MSTLKQLINKFCPRGVEYVRLGDVCILNRYKQLGAEELKSLKTNNGDIHLLPSSRDFDWITNKQLAGNSICKGEVFTLGRARYANPKYVNGYFISSNNIIIESKNREKISTKYLYYFVISNKKRIYVETSTYPKFDKPSFNMLKVPLPPLCVQEKIVKILDKFADLENDLENELRMRKMQFNAYRDKLLTFDNGVKFEKLGDLTTIHRGKRLTKKELYPNEIYNVYHGTVRIPLGRFDKFNVHGDAVIIVNTGSIGEIKYCKNNFWCSDGCFWLKSNDKLNNKFIYYYIKQFDVYFQSQKRPGGVPTIDREIVETLKIPVPPIEKQKEIVEKLDKFNDMCNEISDGLPLEIELRKEQKNYIFKKLLNL